MANRPSEPTRSENAPLGSAEAEEYALQKPYPAQARADYDRRPGATERASSRMEQQQAPPVTASAKGLSREVQEILSQGTRFSSEIPALQAIKNANGPTTSLGRKSDPNDPIHAPYARHYRNPDEDMAPAARHGPVARDWGNPRPGHPSSGSPGMPPEEIYREHLGEQLERGYRQPSPTSMRYGQPKRSVGDYAPDPRFDRIYPANEPSYATRFEERLPPRDYYADVADWLVLTGYHDLPYRAEMLEKFRQPEYPPFPQTIPDEHLGDRRMFECPPMEVYDERQIARYHGLRRSREDEMEFANKRMRMDVPPNERGFRTLPPGFRNMHSPPPAPFPARSPPIGRDYRSPPPFNGRSQGLMPWDGRSPRRMRDTRSPPYVMKERSPPPFVHARDYRSPHSPPPPMRREYRSPPKSPYRSPRPRSPLFRESLQLPAPIDRNKSRKYFLIKSYNYENVEDAMRECTWATQEKNTPTLQEAFKTHVVILFFSVNKSGRFQGYAIMESDIGTVSPPKWTQGLLWPTGGAFRLRWMARQDLDFYRVSKLLNEMNENQPVIIGRDGQEIDPKCGDTLAQLMDEEEDDAMRRARPPFRQH